MNDVTYVRLRRVPITINPDSKNYFITLYIAGWVIMYSYFMPVWETVKTAAPRCRGQLDTLLPEAERPMAMVHWPAHGAEG